MSISDETISDAVARYDRERDRYLKLAARVADICRSDIVEADAIRAHVTSRAKSVSSFEGKLKRFAKKPDKSISSVDEVFKVIGDFSGVRIATYQREDEERVVEAIKKKFCHLDSSEVQVERKDKLEDNPENKNFYRAIHCQVSLLESDLVGVYENLKESSCEIQICSMMAHVWNEVEHDIGYKPDSGGPEIIEREYLTLLGEVTRNGDRYIASLLKANADRLSKPSNQSSPFIDVYDFVGRVRSSVPVQNFSRHAGQLFEEMKNLDLLAVQELEKVVGENFSEISSSKEEIGAFNSWLGDQDQEYLLDADSSDLILIKILNKHARKIEENHPAGRGRGRPLRIRSIATRFQQFIKEKNSGNNPSMSVMHVENS